MMLHGKTFISTVSANKSGEIKKIFSPLGATIIDFPMIEITPVDLTPRIKDTLERLITFHWIIFTSANGVKHFYNLLNQVGKEPKIPLHVKIAAIGIATANELEKTDRKPEFTGSGNNSDDLANEFIEKAEIQNQNILLALGNLAPEGLQKKLSEITNISRINVYNTVKPNTSNDEPLKRIKNNQYDLILFTSSSGVENFMDALGIYENKASIRSASIGEVTSKAVRKNGLTCVLTAKTSTYKGLAEEIIKYYS
jgi:uroporphyrinogen-III synthase